MTETPPPSPVAPSDPTLSDPAADRVLPEGPSMPDSGPRSEIADYVAEVRDALADLDADELDDILDDLISHLRDVRASVDGPLNEIVGGPRAYAAELRASAGLPPAPPFTGGAAIGPGDGEASAQPESPGDPSRAVLAADPLTRWVDEAKVSVRDLLEQVRGHRWWREVVAFLTELRPAWWVARAWMIVVLVGSVTSMREPSGLRWLVAPSVFGSSALGLLVLAGAVVFSVRRGRSPAPDRRPNRWLIGVLMVGAALLCLVVLAGAAISGGGYIEGQAPSSWSSGGGPSPGEALNVYAYLPDGTPIDQVLLFDEQGRPLVVGGYVGVPGPDEGRAPYSVEVWSPVLSEQVEVVLPVDADGQPVPNLYPRRLAATEPDRGGGARRRMLAPPDVSNQFPPTTAARPAVDAAPGTTVPSAPPVTQAAGPGPTEPGTPVDPESTVESGTSVESGPTVEPGTTVESGPAPAPNDDDKGSGTGGGS